MFTLKTGRLEVMSIVLTGTFKTSYMDMVFLLIPPFFLLQFFHLLRFQDLAAQSPQMI